MSFAHTVKTDKDLDGVVADLTQGLKEINFGVLEILDFKKILSDKGLAFADD